MIITRPVMFRSVFTLSSRSVSVSRQHQQHVYCVQATPRQAKIKRTAMRKMNKTKLLQLLSRLWNGSNGILAGKHAEQKMISILRNRFPQAQLIEVTDVSGGCGAMFDINVVAPEFKGLNTMKQHRIINEVLKEEIKDMHGLRIRTSIPQA